MTISGEAESQILSWQTSLTDQAPIPIPSALLFGFQVSVANINASFPFTKMASLYLRTRDALIQNVTIFLIIWVNIHGHKHRLEDLGIFQNIGQEHSKTRDN
ncbi:hypothetical protein FRX31_029893 [Thalictrum thalictroides]|uniref:Uncharacterized protein n=1 Tax=Thalictrum thalictroides TaxID=46969 RepID=A0A7J6V7Z0_THATH|nr:hypothetical protein FRX31_029893 [Thalictrum thalictroides]